MNPLHTLKRMQTTALSASMLLTCSAMAVEVSPTADDLTDAQAPSYLFISQTEPASKELTFQLSGDALEAVSAEGAEVTWTLERLASYANPGADDPFYPLHGEDEM